MGSIPNKSRGMYFEEFQVGTEIATQARTITEADIVNFAGLSGDYNRLHMDDEFSRGTQFGQRVAHGLLGVAVASGLAVQTGFMEDTILAFREISGWKFSRPILVGDTVHVVMRVIDTKCLPRLGGGRVTIDMDVKNQDGVSVQHGAWIVLMQSQPE